MSSHSARRRSPLATSAVILLALLVTGALYAVLSPRSEAAAGVKGQNDPIAAGRELFLANCSTCHGINAQGSSDGPSLVGVGAAAVDFQVGTGRMPAYTSDAPQIPKGRVVFSQNEIDQLAAYIASLGPGPSVPTQDQYSTKDLKPEQIAEGGELFRTNCAMCHNFNGSGGALTHGKYAPSLVGVQPKYIYEAMLTGPQSMPVFGSSLSQQQKQQIIGYLGTLHSQPNYGGLALGTIGPVSEGLFMWIVGIGALIGCAVWLGAKAS